jgi:HD-GYP domain-containing protein (c-di-GMP phosphodiesterase class II)
MTQAIASGSAQKPSALPRVAVLDGNRPYAAAVCATLGTLYPAEFYPDAEVALRAMRLRLPRVLLVDEAMPPRGGRDFAWSLCHGTGLVDGSGGDCSIILTVAGQDSLTLPQPDRYGVSAYLRKPYRKSALLRLVSDLVSRRVEAGWEALPALQCAALRQTASAFRGMSDYFQGGEPPAFSTVQSACLPLVEAVGANSFKSILDAVKDHDDYTYAHSLRVAALLTWFGTVGNLSEGERLVLATGGLLHDVGKASIPLEVLNKPGRLSPAERGVVEGHVEAGQRFLADCEGASPGARVIAAQHHEKLDGTGYPKGLTGGMLNELARMAAIVDIFSALTDRRTYKPAMPAEQALRIMTGEMAAGLDASFLRIFRQFVLDSGAVA